MTRPTWETPVVGVDYLYVAQWPDGSIKAGLTRRVLERRKELERVHGACTSWRIVEKPVEHRVCESILMRRLRRIAIPIAGRNEWFFGIRLNAAFLLASQMAHVRPDDIGGEPPRWAYSL